MKKILPLLVLTALSVGGLSAGDAPRPNILYLYVDDLGWGSIGPNGQEARRVSGLPRVLTPNIDRLAALGVNFTRGYGCTVCSPARSSQQSGFHQGHTYADRNHTNNAKKAMRADDVLMGDVLSAAGYATGYWGKWGYGASQSQINPAILNVQTLPSSHGYQHVLAELHHVRAHTFFQPTLWSFRPGDAGMSLIPNSMSAYAHNSTYPEYPALQSDETYPTTAYCDDSYAFAALDFVRSQAQVSHQTGRPFFGLLAVQVPHSPYGDIAALPGWDGAYSGNAPFRTLGPQARQWAAMVTRVDAHFGNIIAALEDPNGDGDRSDSVTDNTLVIFQSDNGGPGNNARSELDANGGLRGSKGSIWEGGIRVPLVVRWPAMITGSSTLRAGTSSDLVVDVTDFLPTFCELAGVDVPVGIDGVSLAPTLTGTGHQRQREFLIHEAGSNHSIIRGRHKLVGPANLLYDLAADPGESDDISAAHPELVAELESLMRGERVTEPQWFANTYHRWSGADGAGTSDAGNWSDYIYANEGITYQADRGAPRISWNAVMENTGLVPVTARADGELAFLGLKIAGASSVATQTLDLNSRTLTGRNEVRLAAHSSVLLDGGTIESLRWVDVREDAELKGAGTVDASLYNRGVIRVTQASAPAHRTLRVQGNYHEFGGSILDIAIGGAGTPGVAFGQLLVMGEATLAGSLAVTVEAGVELTHGETFTVLTAGVLHDTFENAGRMVTGSDGTRFQIGYSDQSVTLTVEGVTSRGTPYSWIESHNLGGGDPETVDLLDHDGDGMLAWEEYLAGTDPRDPHSRLSLAVESTAGGADGFTLRWSSAAGRIYHILSTTDLRALTPHAGPIAATPPENSLSFQETGHSRQFFLVSVEMP